MSESTKYYNLKNMKSIDKAEEGIRHSLAQMWQLVARQVQDVKTAIVNNDKELANEVLVRERLIDNYELQIDKRCEQFTALQNPVAIDLRFVLSHLKMNSNLERIADLAEGVASYVVKHQTDKMENGKYNVESMINNVHRMLELAYQSYMSYDTNLALKVLAMDTKVDSCYEEAIVSVSEDLVAKDATEILHMLNFTTSLRRIERMGDRCTNLAENIIFYIDAKELKHSSNIPTYKEESE